MVVKNIKKINHDTDATIVGAGPIGSYLGYKLSKKGVNNTILEEHSTIGKPEQCTGIISRNVENYIFHSFFKKAILNKVSGAQICCGNNCVDIKAKEFKAYIFDRAKFDQCIAEQAVKAGSELLLNTRFISHEKQKDPYKSLKISLNTAGKTTQHTTSILVGADGPISTVAKKEGLYNSKNREFWYGIQLLAEVKNPQFEKDKVQLFFDKKYHDKFFAWVAPVNETTAKIGLATRSDPQGFMDKFLKEHFGGKEGVAKVCSIQEKHYGLIPIYNNSAKLQNKEKNVFLVGDAALQVKATTGGGVVVGMQAADQLCNAIVKGDRDYESRLGAVHRNLKTHLMIRNKLNKFSDERYAELINTLNTPRAKNVLENKGDMDYPLRFGIKLLMAKPSLLKFFF